MTQSEEPDLMSDLVEELKTTAVNVSATLGKNTASSEAVSPPPKPKRKTKLNKAKQILNEEENRVEDDPSGIDKKRSELLKLSADGLTRKSVSYINRASAKVIEKIYAEYEASRLEKANEFLCDMLMSKFAAMLGGLDAIENPEEMESDLKHDPLLRKDIETVLSYITPYIPCLGILSGGITVGKHMFGHRRKEK